jgi:hypothetical protein
MTHLPYKVYVVVDRQFGERLTELERGIPVWIVDTPANKSVAQRLWSECPGGSHLTGITTFVDLKTSSPEDMFLGMVDTIDLHHGSYSTVSPYTVVEVLGTSLTARVEQELSLYGFDEFRANPEGFSASRSKALR